MDYSKVNKALAKRFGKGEVELRPPSRGIGEYVLWFKSDKPLKRVITEAKAIVNKFQPTRWMDSKSYHTDN